MKFEWDRKKNEINIRKRGVDFADAKEMFEHELLIVPDIRKTMEKIDILELVIFKID